MAIEGDAWPSLPLEKWEGTYETLRLWFQIVGKIRLSQTPWINHSWHVPLYVTTRGLTTSPIPYGTRAFEIDFDFISHRLLIQVNDGTERELPLRPVVESLQNELRTVRKRMRPPGDQVATRRCIRGG